MAMGRSAYWLLRKWADFGIVFFQVPFNQSHWVGDG